VRAPAFLDILAFVTRLRALVVVGALLLVPRVAHADRTMRCGSELVEVGDSMETVAKKCGPPDDVEIHKLPSGRPLLVWVYDFGRNRFVQLAEFDVGLLVDVVTRGYGKKH